VSYNLLICGEKAVHSIDFGRKSCLRLSLKRFVDNSFKSAMQHGAADIYSMNTHHYEYQWNIYICDYPWAMRQEDHQSSTDTA